MGWCKPRIASAIACLLVLTLGPGAAQAAGSRTIVVLGDSLSAAYKIPSADGWVHLLAARLADRKYDYRVVNASIPGDTSAGGLSRLPGVLERERPAILILELGANDGLQGLPLERMKANLAKMIRQARAAGARVLLVGVRMPPNYGPVFTARFAAVYRELGAEEHVSLVPELLKGVAEHRSLMQSDGLHPLAVAEPRLLENVWPTLLPLLAGAAETPASASAHRSVFPKT